MRVSDYITNKLVEFGVRHVFMVTGGGSMFLNYDLGKHPNITPIFINGLAQQNNSQYKYYLRAHAHNCFDTIFYAVPTPK